MISTDVAFFIRDVSDRAEAHRRALTRDQRPPVLYHETDQAGLLGILKKRQFWATDIRYLNDAKEFGFALNLLADAIRADPAAPFATQRARSYATRSCVRRVIRQRRDVRSLLLTGQGSTESMARLHEARIGICHRVFIGLAEQTIDLIPDTSTLHIRCKATSGVGVRLAKRIKSVDPALLGRGEHLPRAEHIAFSLARSFASAYSPFFKDSAFEEEGEWRLAFSADLFRPRSTDEIVGSGDSPLLFRQSGSTLVPYIELAMPPKHEGLPADVSEVIVGPSPLLDLSVRATREFLETTSARSVLVAPTRCPFRPW